MTIYIAELKYRKTAFTSLKAACDHLGVSYASASKGKRAWILKDRTIISIEEVELVRITRKRK
jgi:hypothetical protein